MPKKNFYLSEGDIKIYERAKEYAGESLSAVIVDGLKQFVQKKEDDATGMQEISLLIGRENFYAQEAHFEGIKFTGKKIVNITYDGYQDTKKASFSVYFTRKGKVLVYEEYIRDDGEVNSRYELFNSVNEFMSAGYPSDLICSALKNMPQKHFKELDI